jgi:hypothetical protein
MSTDTEHRGSHEGVELPAPTIWPIYFAFGIALLFMGLVTHELVSWVGLGASLAGAIGWWRQVLPHEQEERVPLQPESERPPRIASRPAGVEHLSAGEERHRLRLPIEVRPLSSGVRGGVAGAVAMAVVACGYGLIAQGSVWFPINLLAGSVLPGVGQADLEQLRSFHLTGFTVAALIHVTLSLLVGLVYAAVLPMLPDRPQLWGGIVAPLAWTTVAWSSIWIVNPALEQHINWGWFIASQIAFGLAAGWAIARVEPIEVYQSLTLAERAGLEATGVAPEREEPE